MSNWISVKDEFPNKSDTSEDFYNEVLVIQLGSKRPVMMKLHEIRNNPFVTYWLSIPPFPKPPSSSNKK